MIIIPAIDIIGGKVVRLEKGDFNKPTSYQLDPVEAAKLWEGQGAKLLHIVDLDGAKEGKIKNAELIIKIIQSVKIPCEVGGGLREEKDAEYFLKKGASRVVFGTKALEDSDYLKKLVAKFKEKIAVSIDFRHTGGKMVVAKTGWLEPTDRGPLALAKDMQEAGVKTIIVTDISKDGTLAGPNIEGLKQMLNVVSISVIASGGIASLKDIKKLKSLDIQNLEGIIIGKALYEGKIDLKKSIEIASSSR